MCRKFNIKRRQKILKKKKKKKKEIVGISKYNEYKIEIYSP